MNKKITAVSILALGLFVSAYLAYNSLSQLGLDSLDLDDDEDFDEDLDDLFD